LRNRSFKQNLKKPLQKYLSGKLKLRQKVKKKNRSSESEHRGKGRRGVGWGLREAILNFGS